MDAADAVAWCAAAGCATLLCEPCMSVAGMQLGPQWHARGGVLWRQRTFTAAFGLLSQAR
jgi:hypothetical protein